jgi:hypothetical protein
MGSGVKEVFFELSFAEWRFFFLFFVLGVFCFFLAYDDDGMLIGWVALVDTRGREGIYPRDHVL